MKRLAIYSQVEKLVREYGTRNPFEILDALKVVTEFSYRHASDGLKGFCMRINRSNYVLINGNLCEAEQRVVASHELGHTVVHRDELKCGALKDFNIYQSTGRIEREANFFGADLLIDDEAVLDLVHSQGANFFDVASSLQVPCEFFAFKLYSMVERGYPMRMPVELNSTFLAVKRR